MQFINDIPLPGNRQDDSIKTILLRTYEELEQAYNNKDDDSKQTGIADLDAAMGGLHPDEVTILAARPAVGKTALALQIILNFARKGNKVTSFRGDESDTNCKRLISNQGTDGQKIRTGKFRKKIRKGLCCWRLLAWGFTSTSSRDCVGDGGCLQKSNKRRTRPNSYRLSTIATKQQ